MGTSGPGTRPSLGCSERWPHTRRILPPAAAASPPPPGQPPPRPIPPPPWPQLLKVAGCLSAREKRRPSGECVFLGGAISGTVETKEGPRGPRGGPRQPSASSLLIPKPPNSRLLSTPTPQSDGCSRTPLPASRPPACKLLSPTRLLCEGGLRESGKGAEGRRVEMEIRKEGV